MYAVAYMTRPCERQTENGDAIVVRSFERGLMFCVIDALGHGQHAADVAKIARETVEACDIEDDVQGVLEKMHGALTGTRGAAALVGKLEGDRLEGCSVGNVDMRVHGSIVPIVLSPGVLGIRVRKYRVFRAEVKAESRIIVHSDGISPRFSARELMSLSVERACQHLLEVHGRAHDDASVFIADVGR